MVFPGFPDRYFHHELRVHGIVAQLTVSSSLGQTGETQAEIDKRELTHLDEISLVIHKSTAGTRIHNIISAADTTFSVHFPAVAPASFVAQGGGGSRQLYLSGISVDFRVLSSMGSVEEVSVYDCDSEIASFLNLGWTGNHPDERLDLDSIKAFSRGLDIVLTLGTPLGHASSFEFRSAGVTLVTRGPGLVPTAPDADSVIVLG